MELLAIGADCVAARRAGHFAEFASFKDILSVVVCCGAEVLVKWV